MYTAERRIFFDGKIRRPRRQNNYYSELGKAQSVGTQRCAPNRARSAKSPYGMIRFAEADFFPELRYFALLPKSKQKKGVVPMVNFRNPYIQKIYKYIFLHDEQTLLIKDIARETGLTRPTVIKYIRWLEKRGLIKKTGKFFKIIPV